MGSGTIPGVKENDNAPVEEKPHDDYTVPQKVHYQTYWKTNQDAVHWIKLSRSQDQGLQVRQTKSFVIITNATVPGDCIDRVISLNGDRVTFERLATPRASSQGFAQKSYWLAQQQQPTLEEGVNCSWEQHATWESKAGVRDETENATEVEIASRKLVRTVSKVDVGTHLSEQEVITKRILKKSNERHLVRTNFVFAKSWAMWRWLS